MTDVEIDAAQSRQRLQIDLFFNCETSASSVERQICTLWRPEDERVLRQFSLLELPSESCALCFVRIVKRKIKYFTAFSLFRGGFMLNPCLLVRIARSDLSYSDRAAVLMSK